MSQEIASPRGAKFRWRDHELEYFDHEYNSTLWNERCVEVAIANQWHLDHEAMDPRYLEVGNVMQHYGWGGHEVVDLFERADGVLNADIFDVDGRYDRILAVSTVEHFGQGDEGQPDSWSPIRGLLKLFGLLAPGGEMLVTIPMGQNPYLDVFLLNDFKGQAFARPTERGTFTRNPATGCWWYNFGEVRWAPAREHGWPSALWVATWSK